MLYAVLPRADWNGTKPIHEHPGAMFVHHTRLYDFVAEITGRDALRIPSVCRQLSRAGSIYIAASRGRTAVLVAKGPR